jgi:hypothetical protein
MTATTRVRPTARSNPIERSVERGRASRGKKIFEMSWGFCTSELLVRVSVEAPAAQRTMPASVKRKYGTPPVSRRATRPNTKARTAAPSRGWTTTHAMPRAVCR